MPNRRDFDHLVSNKFKIEIEGVSAASFISLDGIESRTDVIIFNNGDDMVTRKRPGRTSFSNLVLRRGYTNNDSLWMWYQAVISGKVERKSGSIISLADDGSEILRYNFFEAWPCRWKGFVYEANKADALFEEIEIAIESVERA